MRVAFLANLCNKGKTWVTQANHDLSTVKPSGSHVYVIIWVSVPIPSVPSFFLTQNLCEVHRDYIFAQSDITKSVDTV